MSTNDHDQDPVWDLLDQSPPREAGPLFSRNVMREIRLAGEKATPWWKRLLAPRPLLASSLAAAAAVAIIVSVNPEKPGTGGVAGSDPEDAPTPVAEQLDETLNQELLIAAAEDPTLFSDEQLLALLY